MIGESVFIYSLTLNEVIEGRVEGFSEKDRSKVKILQKVFDGYIRHIVSHAYVFRDRQSAILAREETSLLSINITRLREKTAEIMDIRKLYPVDTKVNVPYYKISGDLQEAPQILITVIGDNLED